MTGTNTLKVDFEQVYRREIPTVYAFLFRSGAPKAELPDLAHDVFATAIKKWASFDRSRPARPWLLGIAWRVMSDYRSRKRPETVDELPDVAADSDPHAALEAQAAQQLLQRALLVLDETKRAAFVMHELQEMSVNEVSEAMECPAQTTYSRLRAAREEVATAIRRFERGER